MKLNEIFGKPNEGVHRYRIFGLAAVDLGATVLVAAIISYFWRKNFFLILGGLFITGIVAHRVFGVKTKVDKVLFGR